MPSKTAVRPACPICPKDYRSVIKYGFFKRETGRMPRIQRYFCKLCRSAFSAQTGGLTYRERKPHLTQLVMRSLMESVSQRGCSRMLGCRPVTVARKMVRLGARAEFHLKSRASIEIANGTETTAVFDEMETFEHSKCKPVSIALAVSASTRQVIAVHAAQMPAKGMLKDIALKRYGPRKDLRRGSLEAVLSEVVRLCPNLAIIKSDQCPRYRRVVKKKFPKPVLHQAFKGRRGCVVGQGELKRGGRDPLFALNHTCAMFRDRIKRLARRTWCTTKKIDRLNCLLYIYAWWHNQSVTGTKRPFRMR
ncbi:MAG: IS1 family transposase [Deltaproteobacteria bacterium]|nr:IS1 family transposase [Deltaproteobacteria bacterium]